MVGSVRCATLLMLCGVAESWIISIRPPSVSRLPRPIQSTPFEADLYDDDPDNQKKPTSSLAVNADTKLVVGINKYSHDTALCAADANTGQVLFALSKERLSRRKHDAGNVASLVESCLLALDLHLESIISVVVNNHHHRVLPLEANVKHMEWECGLRINGGIEAGYDDAENLFASTTIQHELSHHLAHAYSTATQAPFDTGMVVVLDGMGETYRTMQTAHQDPNYTSDFSHSDTPFVTIPRDIDTKAARSRFDWREAESVYTFSKTSTEIHIQPIFKRFTEEHSPPTLYNHGFENMDSVGALYSRVSLDIFGDWNACGKVMGLAPWAHHSWTTKDGQVVKPQLHDKPILKGQLYVNDDDDNSDHGTEHQKLCIDRSLMEGIPLVARNDPDLFDADGSIRKRYNFDDSVDTTRPPPSEVALEAIALAKRIQMDLEEVVMDFVRHFQRETGETNLCITGGVGLNSVLNGRLARELGFKETFVTAYPGDDGIAVGCCAYALYGRNLVLGTKDTSHQPKLWGGPLSPYMGPDPSEMEIRQAIEEAAPWLDFEAIRNEDQLIKVMAEEVESGSVIAWYQSRSEMGPRALGHRSILADPRKKEMVSFINESVKSRESFRPFAPSVLVEEVDKWFYIGTKVDQNANVSPYMSITAMVHEEKRKTIPAVTHVDGSSRLQTVTKDDEPLYHKFITKFFDLTGVPMILNTSFNTLPGEPIVETPQEAIRSFLYSMGSIEMLVMSKYVIRRKKPDLQKLLGSMTKSGDILVEPVCPERSGSVHFEASFDLEQGPNDEESVEATSRVRMPNRPMHGPNNEWFELLDELEGDVLTACDGTLTLNEIMGQYTATPQDETLNNEDMEATQNLLQNIVHRMVRLYEHTLISW